MENAVQAGGCLCGAVRFEVTGEVSNPHSSSCRNCQQHTGAPTVAWVEFARDQVRWTGMAGAPATSRSSEYSSGAFCAACGSSIGAIDDAPTVALLVGSFDDRMRAAFAPEYHSFKDRKPHWFATESTSRNEKSTPKRARTGDLALLT
jgi:hypothetical protein